MKDKDLSKKHPILDDIINKINRFRWSNYLKDYSGDLLDIQSLYWNIVFNDVYGRTDLQDLSTHLGKSYLGIFFWPHQCYVKILNLFEGLPFYDLDQKNVKWEKLKNEVLQRRGDSISDIVVLTHKDPPDSPYVTKYSLGHFSVDFRQFDNYYIDKTEAISIFLSQHWRRDRFWLKTEVSSENYLLFHLDPQLIKQLHTAGEEIAKTLILYRVFSEVDKQKKAFMEAKEQEKKLESKEQGMTDYEKEMNREEVSYSARRQIRKSAVFTINNRTTPSEAIKTLIEENPDFNKLSLSQIKHLILTRFVDVDGKPLKTDSVYKALQQSSLTN